ncbi:MAG: hypothetical protein KAS32_23435 [Candidatus Peribacteraceae bacterium]|nr:hypothetical protein [Candidatus Peribacteraceae bacterium]
MFTYQLEGKPVWSLTNAEPIRLGLPYLEVPALGVDEYGLFDAIESFDEQTKNPVYNIPKAKEITHHKRRAKRALEFAPHDEVIRLDIPGQDRTAAEAARVNIRAVDAQRQTDIDNCADEAALRVLIETEEL